MCSSEVWRYWEICGRISLFPNLKQSSPACPHFLFLYSSSYLSNTSSELIHLSSSWDVCVFTVEILPVWSYYFFSWENSTNRGTVKSVAMIILNCRAFLFSSRVCWHSDSLMHAGDLFLHTRNHLSGIVFFGVVFANKLGPLTRTCLLNISE